MNCLRNVSHTILLHKPVTTGCTECIQITNSLYNIKWRYIWNINTEMLSRNRCCRGKGILWKLISVCVCIIALVTPHAIRNVPASYYLSTVSCLAVPGFSTLSYKWQDFRKKKLLDVNCLLWYSLKRLSGTFLTLRKIKRDVIVNFQKLLVFEREILRRIFGPTKENQIWESKPTKN